MVTQGKLLQEVAAADLDIVSSNGKSYYNVPCGFDIEVSSFYRNGNKQATMYLWMFGIQNWVTYGRTWDEYKKFIGLLSRVLCLDDSLMLVCYIHNFPYEFQFMRKHFQWDKLFFLESRKPVYGITGSIEYRCSLKLAQKRLELVGKDLMKYKVEKAVGELDYTKIRTSTTPLTEEELHYGEMDIRVILSYIQEKIESDGSILKIPLTNTGYVRNYCRKSCNRQYKRYRALMSALTLEPDEYLQLKQLFQGGFTHASALYSRLVLHLLGSFDFGSSYPAVMLLKKFPMSKGKRVTGAIDYSQLQSLLANYCCMFDLTLYDVYPKVNYDHPISRSKLLDVSPEDFIQEDNGRVVIATKLTITCNEVDFQVYEQFYEWSSMEIKNMWIYQKGYLPKDFTKAVLKLYGDKTTLKGVEGQELNYMISKGMLNSCYGMMVTDIVRDIIECNTEASDESQLYIKNKPDLEQAIVDYNSSVKRFLFYPWGVWVTSYARANLFSGILAFGNDYVYSDTDSIKALHPEKHMDYINSYNNHIEELIQEAASFHKLDPDLYSPLTKKGVKKIIGQWEFEGIYDRFKTLGAKRYLVQIADTYYLTVAGLNKEQARNYLVEIHKDPMKAFNDKLVVPPDYSGRLTSTYIDDECEGTIVDYTGAKCYYHELSSIHMEASPYEMTMSDMYRRFLDFIQGYTEELR